MDLGFSSKNACSSFCSVPDQTFLDAHRERTGTTHDIVYIQSSQCPEQGLVARRSFVLARNAVCKAIAQKISDIPCSCTCGHCVLRCLLSCSTSSYDLFLNQMRYIISQNVLNILFVASHVLIAHVMCSIHPLHATFTKCQLQFAN